MGSPLEHLNFEVESDSIYRLLRAIQLPQPLSVQLVSTTAEYHKIYSLKFAQEDIHQIMPHHTCDAKDPRYGYLVEREGIDLVLRISGPHFPKRKTLNEVAVMKWVKENTNIPLPVVVRYDASSHNAIGYEYTLLTKVPGKSISDISSTLDLEKKHSIVRQLTGFVSELHKHSWTHVGGLQIDDELGSVSDSSVIPGPILNENMWLAPEIESYWGSDVDVDSINLSGPYEKFSDYIAAHVTCYEYAISHHTALEWMRDLLPRLKDFKAAIRSDDLRDQINSCRYILAHRDLHFGNIMCDPETATVTGILDWEFAAVVPTQLWDPSNAFLWNGSHENDAKEEQRRLRNHFVKECKAVELKISEEEKPNNQLVIVQAAIDYLRAIVEVCPRGQKSDTVMKWRQILETKLNQLRIV